MCVDMEEEKNILPSIKEGGGLRSRFFLWGHTVDDIRTRLMVSDRHSPSLAMHHAVSPRSLAMEARTTAMSSSLCSRV